MEEGNRSTCAQLEHVNCTKKVKSSEEVLGDQPEGKRSKQPNNQFNSCIISNVLVLQDAKVALTLMDKINDNF